MDGGSPAKDGTRSLMIWRRKTSNIFAAIPTLLTLYFTGAGLALTITTRTFVAFHITSHPNSQASFPLVNHLSLTNSTHFIPMVATPKTQVALEQRLANHHNLRSTPPKHTPHCNSPRNPKTSTITSLINATSSQSNLNTRANVGNSEHHLPKEPDFMQPPSPTKRTSQSLQRKLQQKTAAARRRWLRSNWSRFNVLNDDNLSNQFHNRLQTFLCTNTNANSTSSSSSTGTDQALQYDRTHKADEVSICKVAVLTGAFCRERFFMTWMSPVGSFSPRERIALESIFKHHPGACVVILSRTLDSTEGRRLLAPFRVLNYRVTAIAPDLHLLFQGTRAANWMTQLREGVTDPGWVNLMQNLSNVMRLAVLYRYGGVYVDTDVVVVRSLAGVRNAVGAQSKGVSGRWTRLNNAVLVFDRGHPVVRQMVREFVAGFDGSRWGWNGPYLVSRVVKTVQTQRANWSEVSVLSVQAFYPVNWMGVGRYFQKPGSEADFEWQHCGKFAHHPEPNSTDNPWRKSLSMIGLPTEHKVLLFTVQDEAGTRSCSSVLHITLLQSIREATATLISDHTNVS